MRITWTAKILLFFEFLAIGKIGVGEWFIAFYVHDYSAYKKKVVVIFSFKDPYVRNQLINQFINVNVWDGVAPIIRARGSCIKRMTIKILSQ